VCISYASFELGLVYENSQDDPIGSYFCGIQGVGVQVNAKVWNARQVHAQFGVEIGNRSGPETGQFKAPEDNSVPDRTMQ
jgi:hypothetical protein